MMPLIIRSSLRNKMAMAFLLVGLVPLIFGAWMGGRVIEKTLIEQAGEQLNSILAMKSAQLNDFFADRREEMDFAIHDPDVREAVGRFSQIFSEHPDAVHQSEWVKASNELGGWFERYLSLNHYYDILLLDAQGNVVFSVRRESDLGQNVVHGPLSQSPLGKVFQRGRQGVVIQDFEPYIPSDSKSFVFTAGPVFAGNNLNGIMVAQISRERLNAIMVFNHGLGETGETYLVGRVDSVIGYRNDRLGKGITSDREVADYFHVLQALDGKGDMEVGVNQDGSQDLKVYSPVVFPDLNWAIVATRSLQEVLAPKQQLLNIFLLEVLATALVVLVASWGVVLLFYRPIVHLTHVSERLQAGEWSARAEWPSQDELGRMARAFNRMAQQFETSLWIKSQSASLAEVLQSAKTMELFAEVLLSTLLPLIKGEHGRLYSLNRYTGRYELVGPMRFFQQDEQSMGFALGEGLIGLVAKEKKVRTIEVADGGQVRLRGGLADIVPLHLYLQPIVMEGETLAVLEFVSQTPFGIPGLGLLQEISTLIALTLDNLRAKVDLEHMLDQSQRFRTELEAQAQEVNLQKRLLEQNNDELTQQSLELERQQEVVNANNTQLEQKNRELELQTEELTRTRHHAEKISQYKTDFLANMSHELRTPLNSLLILARELEENRAGNLTEDQLQSARIIHASGGELLQLINGILDLSKIESGGLHWMVEKIDLEIFSKDIETRFQGEARAKSLGFKVTLAAGVQSCFYGDHDKILRILLNFIANAFKFTRKGSVVVEMTTTLESDARTWFQAMVRDTGIGIPYLRQEAIFAAFQQGDGSTTREFGGTGLGLTIAKRLADFLGGTIQLQSVEHQGSAFTLRIPEALVAATPPMLAPVAHPGVPDDQPDVKVEQRQGHPAAILIIEDDPEFGRILDQMARERGFSPFLANSGREGLNLARQLHPVGIILDLGLPDMDGWQVMDQLKGIPGTRNIPVHIISAREDSMEGVSRGAVGVLIKPVVKEQLTHVFDQLGRVPGEGRIRLLLVEDNANARTAIATLLKEQNLDIIQAASGQEAMDLLKEQHFHCMILDLNLPDISGFDLLERLHQGRDTLPVPVIIHSGRELTSGEYARLKGYTNAIVTKSPRSAERLLDEVVLFLHHVLDDLPPSARFRSRTLRMGQEEMFRGRRLLLVEDDVRSAFAMGKNLESLGLRVQMVVNGQKALEVLEKDHDFDAILMDIMMPVMDGLETTRRIREHPEMSNLPIITLTAKAMNDDRELCLAAGASDYLTKPVDMDRLLAMLKVWFGRQG